MSSIPSLLSRPISRAATRRFLRPILLAGCTACAGVRPTPVATSPAVRPAFAALSVTDLTAMADWYQTVFDLPVRRRLAMPDSVGSGAILESPLLRLELLSLRSVPSAAGPRPPARAHGIFKFGLSVATLDSYLERFSRYAVRMVAGPFVDSMSQTRQVIVADPEGNLVQLFAPAGQP